MGTSSILDIIGSFMVAGILLIMGLTLSASSNEVRAVYSGNYNLQTNLTTLVEMLQTDFKKIGYCRVWQNMSTPLVVTKKDTISFRADLNNTGAINIVTYYKGPVSELNGTNGTPNPIDFYLYRKVDNTAAVKWNFGLTQFSFSYRDAVDSLLSFPIADPRLVYYMTLTLAVSSPAPYKEQFLNDSSRYTVIWKQMRLVSKNLTNR
jgi:hypothetical protein